MRKNPRCDYVKGGGGRVCIHEKGHKGDHVFECGYREEPKVRLITLAEFEHMTPFIQGYVIYMQADLDGSELKNHQDNPYTPETKQHLAFQEGSMKAMLDVQDGEE